VKFIALASHLLVAAAAALPASDLPATDPGALFAAGNFPGALASARATLKGEPANAGAALVAGTVELYENHLARAQSDLESITPDAPEFGRATRALAEIHRREQLRSRPETTFDSGRAIVPFVQVDPLPSVAVRVNGQRAIFQIDTGAPGITVDAAFAQRLNLPRVPGTHIGIFPGGRGEVNQVRIDALTLGNATLRNVASDELPIRAMMPGASPVDGVIGTGVFERFAGVTIDYAGARLILYAPGTSIHPTDVESVVPFWLVGDHFVVTRGAIAGIAGLVLLDSGLVGGGVAPSTAVVRRAHLISGASDTGFTANGRHVRLQRVDVPTVRVGDSLERDVRGFYQPGPSPLDLFPFALLGAVSHDFFRHRALTIDFTSMRVSIARRT
jgi:hypothetical protein